MARTDRDSQYGSGSYGSYSSSQNTSNRSQSYGGGADDRKQAYRTSTVGRANAKKAAAISAKNKAKKDMEDFANLKYEPPKFVPSIVGTILSKTIGKKTFEINKSYYTKNVIGKTNPKTGKAYAGTIEDYKGYMSGRGSGDLDAMGRTITRDNDGGSDFVVEKNVGGKTILTTEKKVAKDAEAKKEYDERTTKKRGRRKTIMTGSLGVTKVSSDYSLGKPTLLGKV